MRAFLVLYDGPGYEGFSLIVLADSEDEIEFALQEKSLREYEIKNPSCRIRNIEEIALSKVQISELSITEFLKITNR